MPRPPLPPALEPILDRSPSETTALLLALARLQAARKSPADLLTQQARDGFVQPCPLDQRTVHRLDGLALDAAEGFEAVQLSPVAPLGACSALAPTSQDRTLSTTRGTEVVSDPTNALALACALRLRRAPAAEVRLCTLHQVLRAQALPPVPGYTRHFRLFALAEAGAGRPDEAFEVEAIVRHMRVFDRLLDAGAAHGFAVHARSVRLGVGAGRQVLGVRVSAALRAAFPRLEIVEEALDAPYYDGLRVRLDVVARSGAVLNLADVGLFDWMARLLSNRKLRFVASGCGIQLLPLALAE